MRIATDESTAPQFMSVHPYHFQNFCARFRAEIRNCFIIKLKILTVLPKTSGKDADLLAQRICKGLAEDTGAPVLSVSVGSAAFPEDGKTIESLLQTADSRALQDEESRKTS